MNRNDIALLLTKAKEVTNHDDYVIIGSLSILGASDNPPLLMTGSNDVDLYPKNDPGRASEVMAALGDNTPFGQQHGFHADAVSPYLPTLPDGWEDRLIKISFENGINAWFLEPNDAAVSKYVRSENRDREWIREGLAAELISLPTIEYRLRETMAETDELQRARSSVAQDRDWIDGVRAGSNEPAMYKRLVVDNGVRTFYTSLDGKQWLHDVAMPAPAGVRADTYDLTRSKPVDPMKPGPVTGVVIHVDEKYIYQEMGRNNIARHERRYFPQDPDIGRYARFQYQNGKATDVAVTQHKGRALGR